MKLSVILVNRNTCALLQQALYTITKACDNIEYELFIVDNASADQSVNMVQRDFPQANLIVNDKNVGISVANNQALIMAQGEYVLLINPDTITKKDTLLKTIDFMERHPLAGGLSVRMIDPMGNFLKESKRGLMPHWIAFFKLTGLSKMLSKSRLYDRTHEFWIDEFETAEIDILNSANMLLRRSVLLGTGFMDERFFMYGQNIDLSYRIRLAGFKNYYFPKTYIINFKQTVDKFSWEYLKHFYGAMLIFAGKYMFKLPCLQLKLKGMGPMLQPSYEVEQ